MALSVEVQAWYGNNHTIVNEPRKLTAQHKKCLQKKKKNTKKEREGHS